MTPREQAAHLMAVHGLPVETHRGQLRMAERLVGRHRDVLRHVHGIGWHRWDGTRWRLDLDAGARRAAVDTVKAAYADLPRLGNDDQKALLADIHKCESAGGLDGVLTLAGSLLPFAVSVDKLDADPYLFNVTNGTLDLRTGRLRPHDPDDLITKAAGCGYDPDAVSIVFDTFLSEILPDPETRDYVARIIGHALVGKVVEHLLPIFTGAGLNGKSTLVDTAAAAFGDYAISVEPDLLVERPSSHTTGQADLLGVRLAVCSETDEGRRLAAATVKRLTGGDKMRARRMRQDNIEWSPSHTALMVTNHKPVVAGDDPALWRRLRIVPFDTVVANPNTALKDQLALELPAVLAWIVAGHNRWHTDGLAEPATVTAATSAYQASSDALGRFFDERIFESTAGVVRARDLFNAWTGWCKEVGEESGTEVSFAEAMRLKGHHKIKQRTGMAYVGVHLLDSSEEVS